MLNFIRSLFGRQPRIVIPKFQPYVSQFESTSNSTTIVIKSEPKAKAVKAKPVKKSPVAKIKAVKPVKEKIVKSSPVSTPTRRK